VLPALIDYGIPVAIVENAGTTADALHAIVRIYPEWSERLCFGPNVEGLVDAWLGAVERRLRRDP